MCGICGIVDYSGSPIDPASLNRVRDAMTNRGPDDCGTQILPYAGLGHRRLSIIDLSPRGRQPMTNEDGSVWLVFNGEIYDFQLHRRQLLASGHAFTSESDSEVLVHGYEEWGVEGLAQRVNGMFAFAIWDARQRELHLVRDRLGKKPLYYGWIGGRFAFASELKALWTLAPGELRVAPESVGRFLYWGYLPGRDTIYRSLFQLPPARILSLTMNGARERRYWRLSFADKIRAPARDVIEQADALLTSAVRRRLRADVPLGAFLSGGVDSSYVVSRMASAGNGRVRTFAMGTSDSAHDERPQARLVAAHCGTDHTEFEVTPAAWELLPRLVWEFGQPFADPACIPTYYVAERARQHVTVALTGDGGDESFAGYSHHHASYLGAPLARVLPDTIVNGLLRASTRLMDDGGATTRASVARSLRYLHTDPLVRWAAVDLWALHHLPRLFSARYRDLRSRDTLLGEATAVDADFDGADALDRALHHDINWLLPFCYNVKLDVGTMINGLEARSPFMDREVVEWAARVPSRVKMRPWQKKALLKRVAARSLPREVIYRPKHGFSVPMDGWFRGSWAAAAHDIIFSKQARDREYFDYKYLDRLWTEHHNRTANHGVRFWSLLWLEVWHQVFLDRTMAPPGPTVASRAAEPSADSQLLRCR